MKALEPYTHSFIVKVWLEETAEKTGRASWRGHVTHVPSGERRYVKELDELVAIVASYLKEMGIDFHKDTFVRRWLKRLRSHSDFTLRSR